MGKFAFYFTKPGEASIVYLQRTWRADRVALKITEIKEESTDPESSLTCRIFFAKKFITYTG